MSAAVPNTKDFKDVFGKIGSDEFPAEAGRYVLYQHDVCPFAHRAVVAHKIAGLDGVVDIVSLAPTKNADKKWQFTEEFPDKYHSEMKSIVELYDLGAPGFNGAHSVPVLFDTKTQKIVSNSSAEICENIVNAFGNLSAHKGRTLSPEGSKEAVEEANKWLTPELVFAPYGMFFAKDQKSYDEASQKFFGSPDSLTGMHKLEATLKNSKFIAGDAISVSDIFAYVVVYRIPYEFARIFGATRYSISSFPNVAEWFAAIHNIAGVRECQEVKNMPGALIQWRESIFPGSPALIHHIPDEKALTAPAPAARIPFSS